MKASAHGRRREGAPAATLKWLASCAAVVFALALVACNGGESERAAAELTGGTPSRGRDKIRRYGCASCHTIPGVEGADSLVGPPLTRIASRTYLGGVLTNSPEHMIRWIRDPRGVDPLTAMPNLGVTEEDARDIASYLYTLK
ncbi:MAG TPA: c-type cytochrome [Pyrinomonadaceae bacterium]|nr:c-type cytochrome [Pyrinomonadaceae bacterium]